MAAKSGKGKGGQKTKPKPATEQPNTKPSGDESKPNADKSPAAGDKLKTYVSTLKNHHLTGVRTFDKNGDPKKHWNIYFIMKIYKTSDPKEQAFIESHPAFKAAKVRLAAASFGEDVVVVPKTEYTQGVATTRSHAPQLSKEIG